MELNTLQALYLEELRDIYSAEKQILKALPKMKRGATHPALKDAFETHRAQTEEQIARLERIFQDLGVAARAKHCKGMEGVLAEGAELLEEDAEPEVMDAGLIAKAQHVEHYEMAGYGTVRTYAELLGHTMHRELLQQTLNEEEETDRLLTELATSTVNLSAVAPDGDDDEGDESSESDDDGDDSDDSDSDDSDGRSARGGSRTTGKTANTGRTANAGKASKTSKTGKTARSAKTAKTTKSSGTSKSANSANSANAARSSRGGSKTARRPGNGRSR